MNNRTIAIAMAAIMVVTAFAAIGFVDSDADTDNGQKVIIGSSDKPYALNKDSSVEANIKYNYAAFTDNATVSFAYAVPNTEIKGDIAIGAENSTDINGIGTKIAGSAGSYTVTFTGTTFKSLTESTEIDFTLSVVDHITVGGEKKDLPTQTYVFKAYLIVIDSSQKTIKLNDGKFDIATGIEFVYENSYSITASVVDSTNSNNELSGYKFYATRLPAGLSMTVDGKIGGMLSSTQESTNGTFTVYAVSEIGDVVQADYAYTIAGHTDRDFHITSTNNGDRQTYATVEDGSEVNLTITPTRGELKSVTVYYSGTEATVTNGDNNVKNASFVCNGTGTIVVTVTASVDGSLPITHTFTVYVVGHIYNTDLDPEVSSA